jgi:3-hydroxymyristoyl/3-hydroxydecanoyl-(acyl carrier protein) dehydratase
MAQVGGYLLLRSVNLQGAKKVLYFTGIDHARFRRPVVPGDQIRFEVDLVQLRRHVCRMKGVALVDGKTAAEAEMNAVAVDRDPETSPAEPRAVSERT